MKTTLKGNKGDRRQRQGRAGIGKKIKKTANRKIRRVPATKEISTYSIGYTD